MQIVWENSSHLLKHRSAAAVNSSYRYSQTPFQLLLAYWSILIRPMQHYHKLLAKTAWPHISMTRWIFLLLFASSSLTARHLYLLMCSRQLRPKLCTLLAKQNVEQKQPPRISPGKRLQNIRPSKLERNLSSPWFTFFGGYSNPPTLSLVHVFSFF